MKFNVRRYINEFIGKQIALAEHATGTKNKLVTLVPSDGEIECHYNEAVLFNGECTGLVSSGGYTHTLVQELLWPMFPQTR